ncbi:STAS domain-containing protein [Streptomyces sp. NPDC049813]|uniref:STAS domain-containing protein n=1 Tax=Streptomyces sp. NPDC049813 TaxID=3365597 RepID=UPI0037AD00DE
MPSETALVSVGRLHVHRSHGCTILSLHGDIDIAAALQITPRLAAAIQGSAPRVVVDLGSATFFDASGLRVLNHIRQRVHERDGRLAVVCPRPIIRKVLRVAGLLDLYHPALTLEAAVRTLLHDEPL